MPLSSKQHLRLNLLLKKSLLIKVKKHVLRLTEKYFTLNALGYNELLEKKSEFVDNCHNQY